MIIQKHAGISIEYNENSNTWKVDSDEHEMEFEADSLADAKKRIDLNLKKKGEGRFKRFKAWARGGYWNSDSMYLKVTVTSIVEGYHKDYSQAWISFPAIDEGKGRREKVNLVRLYVDTPENDEIFRKMNENLAKVNALNKENSVLMEKTEVVEYEP